MILFKISYPIYLKIKTEMQNNFLLIHFPYKKGVLKTQFRLKKP